MLSGLLVRGDRITHAVATLDASAVLPEDLVPQGAIEMATEYLEGLGAAPCWLGSRRPTCRPSRDARTSIRTFLRAEARL